MKHSGCLWVFQTFYLVITDCPYLPCTLRNVSLSGHLVVSTSSVHTTIWYFSDIYDLQNSIFLTTTVVTKLINAFLYFYHSQNKSTLDPIQSQMNAVHIITFFFSVAPQSKSGLGLHMAEVSRSYTVRYTHTHTHTPNTTPLYECSDRFRGRYLHNTQPTQQKNIHALSGIWTRDPSNKAAEHLLFRPHSHLNQPATSYNISYYIIY